MIPLGIYVSAQRNPQPNWNYVVAHIKFEGANGSTEIYDSKRQIYWSQASATDPVLGVPPPVTISTATPKFGSGAGQFDARPYISLPSHEDFNFGTGAWTFKCWIRRGPLTRQYGTLLAQSGPQSFFNAGNRFIMLPSALGGRVTVGGSDAKTGSGSYEAAGNPLLTSTTNVPENVWTHVAVTANGAGNLYLFINGQLESTNTSTANWNFATRPSIHIGANGWDLVDSRYNGQIDHVTILKGICEFTSSFTPPASPTG